MKTANQHSWIQGKPLASKSDLMHFVNQQQINSQASFSAAVIKAEQASSYAVVVADRFILRMIRSGKNG